MSMPLSLVFSASVSFMKAWPPPKSFAEGDGEVFVDDLEGLVELHAGDVVDLLDGGLSVFDGVEEVLALGFEEAVAGDGLVVLLEGHHVDRAHGFELLLQSAGLFFFGVQGIAFDAGDGGVFAKSDGFGAEVVEAGGVDVLDVGGELGGASGERGALFAKGFGLVAEGAETLIELRHGGAELCCFGGEAGTFGDSGGAKFGEFGVLDGEGCGLFFAAEFFCGGGCELLFELLDALALAVVDAVGLLEVGGGVATAFFEAGERGRGCCGCLLEFFAAAAELVELFLKGGEVGFEGDALVLEGCRFLLAAGDEVGLLVAGVAIALAGEGPVLQAALDAGDLGLHLAESCAGVGGLALGVAALVGLAFDGGVEGGDLVLQIGGVEVGLSQFLLGLLYFLLNFDELALEGERALCAGAAAGDGDVVEGLAGGGEEEGLRVGEGEGAGGVGVRRDEAFAKLGQDDFEGLAETVEDADALFERDDAFDAFDVGLGVALSCPRRRRSWPGRRWGARGRWRGR